MAALLLAVLLTVVLSHSIFEPLVLLLSPILSLAWLPWGLLLLLLWLLSGPPAGPDPPHSSRLDRSDRC